MMLDYYNDEGVRDTCHAARGDYGRGKQLEAIGKIADYLCSTGVIKPGDILIPAPQHTGKAEYTLEIARIVASETGAEIADILKRHPGEPAYTQKAKGIDPVIDMYLDGRVPAGRRLFFVDNVYSTGKTFNEAQKLIGSSLLLLVYAIDTRHP